MHQISAPRACGRAGRPAQACVCQAPCWAAPKCAAAGRCPQRAARQQELPVTRGARERPSPGPRALSLTDRLARPARSSPRCSSARRPCTRTTGRCTPMTASAWGPGRAPTSPRAAWCSSCPTRRPGGSSAPWVRSPWRCRTRASAPGVLRPALRLGLGALRTDRLTALPAFCASPYARMSLSACKRWWRAGCEQAHSRPGGLTCSGASPRDVSLGGVRPETGRGRARSCARGRLTR